MVRIEQAALGLLVFSVVMVACTFLITDFSDKYDEFNISTDKFNDTFNQIDEMYDLGKETEEDMGGEEIEEDATEDSIFKAGFKTVRKVFTSIFVIPGNILSSIFIELNIPNFFYVAAMAALFIALSFAIVYLVFRMVVK